VLFNPDGAEIIRLPGDADAPQVMELLQAGMAGGRPVKALLDDALAGRTLAANEWRTLAWYSWDVDDQRLLPRAELPGTLARLAAACPPTEAETASRLWLKALAASDDGKGVKADEALRKRVSSILADPAQSRLQMGALIGGATRIVRALATDDAPERPALVAEFDAALKRLQADTSLSRGDRFDALLVRVQLARLGQPKDTLRPQLPPGLVAELREQAAREDREITDGYERQAIITSAGYALGQAGLWDESDALLKANLARSHSPYYLMSQLGSNARKLGRTDEALKWYEQSYVKSVGPATRLQWGSGYLTALVELAPGQVQRIEQAATRLLADAAKDRAAFEGRSLRSLQRAGRKLVSWSADGQQAAALQRLQGKLKPVCAKAAPAHQAACEGLLKPAAQG
jgi:hypothetical protein